MWHKIIAVGRTGKDAVMRFTPSGEAVTSFSLAVDDGFGDKKQTIWFNVSVWGKTAEVVKEMAKGTKVLVEGRLIHENGSPRLYKKSGGENGASFEISASTVRFLSSREQAETETTGDLEF